MNRRRMVRRGILIGIGALTILLILLMLFYPSVVIKPFQGAILALASERLGAEVNVEEIVLDFFPDPVVVLRQGRILFPDGRLVEISSVIFFPDVSAVLRGKFFSGRLELERPGITIPLAAPEAREKPPRERLIPADLSQRIFDILMRRGRIGLDITIANGSMVLVSQQKQRTVTVRDIDGTLQPHPGKSLIRLSGRSPLWDQFQLTGEVTFSDGMGNASLQIRELHLQPVVDLLLAPAGRVWVLPVNVDVALQLQSEHVILAEARITGADSAPDTEEEHQQTYRIALRRLLAEGRLENDTLSVQFPEISFARPLVTTRSELLITNDPAHIKVSVASESLDVTMLKDAGLGIAPGSRLVQGVIRILKGGTFSSVRLTAEAQNPGRLFTGDTIRLEGTLANGRILVPKADVELRNVNGDAVIAGGVLHADHVKARLENFIGRDGIVQVDLRDKQHPFHIELDVLIDFADRLPILRRWIKDPYFVQVVDGLSELQGGGEARLLLRGGPEGVDVRVFAADFHLFARYPGVPFPLQINSGQFTYAENTIALNELTGTWGASSFSRLAIGLLFGDNPRLTISSPGTIRIVLEEAYPYLQDRTGPDSALRKVDELNGVVFLDTVHFNGPLKNLESGEFRVTGHVQDVLVPVDLLQRTGEINAGSFEAVPEQIRVRNADLSIGDTVVNASGLLKGYLNGNYHLEALIDGTVRQPEIDQIMQMLQVDEPLWIASPLTIAQGELVWQPKRMLSYSGTMATPEGVQVALSLRRAPGASNQYEITVEQGETRASAVITAGEQLMEMIVKGELTEQVLDGLLIDNQILTGRIAGDFQARIDLDQPINSTAQGSLGGEDVVVLRDNDVPFVIRAFSLLGDEESVRLDVGVVAWGEAAFSLTGVVRRAGDSLRASLELISEHIEWDLIRSLLLPEGDEGKKEERDKSEDAGIFQKLPIEGALTVRAGEFAYEDFTWSPFQAAVSLNREREVTVDVTDALLCSISTPGIIEYSQEGLDAAVQFSATGEEIAQTLGCLRGEKNRISGRYNLTGEIRAQAQYVADLLTHLAGEVDFTADDGRVFQLGILAKILTLLSFTDVFQAKLPEILQEGLAYDSIRITGSVQNSQLIFSQLTLDGPSLEIAGEGALDLVTRKIDLSLLVAPLGRVDRILRYIPLVSRIIGEGVVTVPVSVSGDMRDPSVRALPVSAVTGNLRRIMENTIKLPFDLIQPLIPGQ